MIILDTNVLSELLRTTPESNVVDWMHAQSRASLFTTVITQGEMLVGVLQMPEGRRKQRLCEEVAAIFAVDLADRVIVYDSTAAQAHAAIATARRAAGKPMSQSDAMIAGIVRSRDARLATRNVRDFENCGIALIDPWH